MKTPEKLLDGWEAGGGDRRILSDPGTAHLVVEGRKITSAHTIPGLTVDSCETDEGIEARIRLAAGVRLDRPVHLCMGMLGHTGSQKIVMDVALEASALARFITHCVFPEARQIRHVMEASARLEPGAELHYTETHVHGPQGGVLVLPKARVKVARGGRYFSAFNLTTGQVGELEIDYDVELEEQAVAELVARIFGHGHDRIRIRERIVLAGAHSRGLIKSRIALEDDACAEVTGITEGRAAGSRGHVDCMEIVKDRAVANAVPIVTVTHPDAKVTHEAAIGSIDRRQLETLMAHGLDSDEAVRLVVDGILS